MKCSCGAQLTLGTEQVAGRCARCPVVSLDTDVSEVVSHGGVTVVSLDELKADRDSMSLAEFQRMYTSEPVPETKEQRWRRNHADERRQIHRDGQRRRRG